MFKTFCTQASATLVLSLALSGILRAAGPPTIAAVTAAGTPSAGQSAQITVTGTLFEAPGSDSAPAQDLSLNFLPAGSATVKSMKLTARDTIVATVNIASNTSQTINVTVTANTLTSEPRAWNTGIAVNDCLEATKAGGCQLRWEVDATGVTGSGTQLNTTTSTNLMVKLDWQLAKNKDSQLPRLNSKGILNTNTSTRPGAQGWDRFGLHLVFKAGYAPVSVSTQLQQTTSTTGTCGTTTSGTTTTGTTSTGTTSTGTTTTPTGTTSTAASTPCPTSTAASASTTTSTTSTPATCTAATTQQAFVGEVGGHLGWTFLQDGSGTFAEVGFAARGSLQALVAGSQLFQNGNINYQALSTVNAQDAIKLGEVVARFRLGSHDGPASTTTGAYTNTSDLLRIEGGYQYNSGLAQLAGNPDINTKQRLVARFYLFPEVPNSNHTRIPIGIEYSSGFHGGPRVLQIVYGTNLNLGKLFGSNSNQ